MPKYSSAFELQVPVEDGFKVCRKAVADLNWRILEQGKTHITCREPQELVTFTNAVTVQIYLVNSSANSTWIGLNASNFGFGPIQKKHARQQVENLQSAIMNTVSNKINSNSERHLSENIASELERLVDLHTRGVLTEEEFRRAKEKLLDY